MRLISKLMTSHTGLQTITIHILPNISWSKGNQTKFGVVIEYKREIFFFKNHAEKEAQRLVPDLFLFFKETSFQVKAIGPQLNFNIFK